MSNLRAVCRPHTVFSSIACCYSHEVLARCRSINTRVSIRRPNSNPQLSSPSVFSPWFDASDLPKVVPWVRTNQRRRTMVKAANWAEEKSPYETLELERNADDENIKVAYRRLAKFYHPDVYNGKGTLEDGETAEARFIKIQAAYELLIDDKRRRDYDIENRVNPMKASQAWTDWVMKKRKAFDQRGDMAIAAWAELQQQELNIRARRLSRSKIDPDEERRIMARERKASMDYYNSTLKRHTLVLRKRDIMRRKAEEDQKSILSKLLAAEGLELAKDDDDDDKPRLK